MVVPVPIGLIVKAPALYKKFKRRKELHHTCNLIKKSAGSSGGCINKAIKNHVIKADEIIKFIKKEMAIVAHIDLLSAALSIASGLNDEIERKKLLDQMPTEEERNRIINGNGRVK